MSMTRLHLWLAAFVAVVSLATTASAQRVQPFIESDYFEPDFQFFAPAEVSTFGGGEPPNVGFYASYDSLYLNVNRPDGEASIQSPWEGDFGGGNRYEGGYMTDEDTGWQISHTHMNGPGEFQQVNQERINFINTLDIPPVIDLVVSHRNPRIYHLKDSINALTFSSNEINKVWRRDEFHNGAIFEPMIGVRYMNFRDYYRRDQYDRFEATLVDGELTNIPDIDGRFEVLVRDKEFTDNNMLGGQLGFRLSNTYGHWNLSGEVRMFALHNYQFLESTRSTVVTRYDLVLVDVDREIKTLLRTHARNEEFVWGGELRGEAAYEVTRDISLRFGFMILNMAQGISRGGNPIRLTNQDVFMGGVTVGLTVNR